VTAGTLTDFDRGFVVGLLVAQGHFGGDGKQPHITLRMHVRHEALFRRLIELFPRTRLYGPYHHGNRHYFQWMARGPGLVQDVMPVLEHALVPDLDGHAHDRYRAMVDRYAAVIARAAASAP